MQMTTGPSVPDDDGATSQGEVTHEQGVRELWKSLNFMTEDEQGDDPVSIQAWIDDLRSDSWASCPRIRRRKPSGGPGTKRCGSSTSTRFVSSSRNSRHDTPLPARCRPGVGDRIK